MASWQSLLDCHVINIYIHTTEKLIEWCGRVGKVIALDAEGVGFKSQRRNKHYLKPFWISQVCIQHEDELGWLVAGLTVKS